jgi:hypothetical protein
MLFRAAIFTIKIHETVTALCGHKAELQIVKAGVHTVTARL